MTNYVAIDFETANESPISACAVGWVRFGLDFFDTTFSSLIRPPQAFDKFSERNTEIHGLSRLQVDSAPFFFEIWPKLLEVSENFKLPLVCHNQSTDMRIIYALLKHYKKEIPLISFFDTLTVSRKLLPQFENHKLDILAAEFGIDLKHHNALSDASACAQIALSLLKQSRKSDLVELAHSAQLTLGKLTPKGIIKMDGELAKPLRNERKAQNKVSSKHLKVTGNIDSMNAIFGKIVVLTGDFSKMSKVELSQRIKNLGGETTTKVSRKTNFVVIGQNDFDKGSNYKKSRAISDAENFNKEGNTINIISEQTFLKSIELYFD